MPTRNLFEKFKAYPIIKHYVTAQSNVFCFIFITISTPIFSDSCESLIGRSSQIFRMISFKEPKISSNNTSKIIEFRQITRVLDIFLLPKPRITNFGSEAKLTDDSKKSLENNGTKILKIRASLFLSCTP